MKARGARTPNISILSFQTLCAAEKLCGSVKLNTMPSMGKIVMIAQNNIDIIFDLFMGYIIYYVINYLHYSNSVVAGGLVVQSKKTRTILGCLMRTLIISSQISLFK